MATKFSLTNLDLEIDFSDRALIINSPSRRHAQMLFHENCEPLSFWALRLGLRTVKIKFAGSNRPYCIPAELISTQEQEQGLSVQHMTRDLTPNGIQIAQLRLSRRLIEQVFEYSETPNKSWGIVRLSDERQVIVSDAAVGFAFSYPDPEVLVQLKRSQYWWLPDLSDFNRDWRQVLSPNDTNSSMEYSYKSCDRNFNWAIFTTRYKLLQDESGELYQVCESVDARAIAPPSFPR